MHLTRLHGAGKGGRPAALAFTVALAGCPPSELPDDSDTSDVSDQSVEVVSLDEIEPPTVEVDGWLNINPYREFDLATGTPGEWNGIFAYAEVSAVPVRVLDHAALVETCIESDGAWWDTPVVGMDVGSSLSLQLGEEAFAMAADTDWDPGEVVYYLDLEDVQPERFEGETISLAGARASVDVPPFVVPEPGGLPTGALWTGDELTLRWQSSPNSTSLIWLFVSAHDGVLSHSLDCYLEDDGVARISGVRFPAELAASESYDGFLYMDRLEQGTVRLDDRTLLVSVYVDHQAPFAP